MFNIIFKENLALIIVLFYLKWYNQAFTFKFSISNKINKIASICLKQRG